jgi:hypothetical protein
VPTIHFMGRQLHLGALFHAPIPPEGDGFFTRSAGDPSQGPVSYATIVGIGS